MLYLRTDAKLRRFKGQPHFAPLVTSIVGGLKDAVVNVFNSLLSGIKNAMSGTR